MRGSWLHTSATPTLSTVSRYAHVAEHELHRPPLRLSPARTVTPAAASEAATAARFRQAAARARQALLPDTRSPARITAPTPAADTGDARDGPVDPRAGDAHRRRHGARRRGGGRRDAAAVGPAGPTPTTRMTMGPIGPGWLFGGSEDTVPHVLLVLAAEWRIDIDEAVDAERNEPRRRADSVGTAWLSAGRRHRALRFPRRGLPGRCAGPPVPGCRATS